MRGLLIFLICILVAAPLMADGGGSFKVHMNPWVVKYANPSTSTTISISATYPCTVTDTTLYSEPIRVGKSAAFGVYITLTNATSADASITYQHSCDYNPNVPANATWDDGDPVETVKAFTAAYSDCVAIGPVPARWIRFKFVHDATDDEWAVTRLVVCKQ